MPRTHARWVSLWAAESSLEGRSGFVFPHKSQAAYYPTGELRGRTE